MIVIYYRTHTQKQEQMTMEDKNDMITTQQPGQNALTTGMRRPAGTLRKDNTYGSQRIFRKKHRQTHTNIKKSTHTNLEEEHKQITQDATITNTVIS